MQIRSWKALAGMLLLAAACNEKKATAPTPPPKAADVDPMTKATQQRIDVSVRQLEVYYRGVRRFPGVADLDAPMDAWNQPMKYTPSDDGQEAELRSPGRDGTLGTDDDVVRKLSKR